MNIAPDGSSVTWTEQSIKAPVAPQRNRYFLAAFAVVAIVFSIYYGVRGGGFQYYMAAFGIFGGTLALLSGSRQKNLHHRKIRLNSEVLTIENQDIPLSELSGFWLEEDDTGLIIHFERKHTRLIPLFCYFDSNDAAAARQIILRVLPEIEPQTSSFTTSIERFFKF